MAQTATLAIKIIADTVDAQKGVDDVASKTSKFGSAMSKAALPAAAALTAVAGAAIAAGKAAAQDEQAQAVLANTLEKTTGATAGQVAAMEDYISKMSLATGVADDELRPAMGNLLRATGDAATSQAALSAALDISASTGKSVESVSQALAKAYGGSTGSLAKLVPSLDAATLASGDMDAIMAELAATTGGAMAASADTAAGKMAIFQNAMGEAQEEAGSALLPIMTKLSDVLVIVAKWVGKNTTLFLVIAGVIATVATAVLAVNAAMKIYQATLIVVQVVQKATWLAALGPIGLVIAAVALVIGAIVLLWHKSETFRGIVLAVWGAVKTAVNTVKETVGDVITKIGDLIGAIGRIKVPGVLVDAFNNIKAAIDGAIDAVQDLIGWISNIKVPHIDLPGPFSLAAPAIATATPTASATTARAAAPAGPTIIINGAIDPEATARQIRRILAGHDRRTGLVTP